MALLDQGAVFLEKLNLDELGSKAHAIDSDRLSGIHKMGLFKGGADPNFKRDGLTANEDQNCQSSQNPSEATRTQT